MHVLSVAEGDPLSRELVLTEVVWPTVGEHGQRRERVLLDVLQCGADLPERRERSQRCVSRQDRLSRSSEHASQEYVSAACVRQDTERQRHPATTPHRPVQSSHCEYTTKLIAVSSLEPTGLCKERTTDTRSSVVVLGRIDC